MKNKPMKKYEFKPKRTYPGRTKKCNGCYFRLNISGDSYCNLMAETGFSRKDFGHSTAQECYESGRLPFCKRKSKPDELKKAMGMKGQSE